MAVRATQAVVPKVVTFYKNGDKFFRGHKLAITPQRYRNMETLLNDLTRLLNLPLGARYVLKKSGKPIENIQEFEHGQGYICSSFPKLKNLKYGVGDNIPYWNSSKHINKDKTTQSTKYKGHSEEASPRRRSETIKPRIITVIRYGHKPRRSAKVLLNKRTAQTLDQVLDEVTAAIGVWGTNGVRRLYDLTGKRVNDLSDLFKEDDCFIAVGNEKLHLSDLEDIVQGSTLKPSQSQKTRLPSINSNEGSDVSQSDQHKTTPRRLQSKNSVKLPTIRRKSNNDSKASSPNSDVELKEFKENQAQNQTVNSPWNEGKKISPRNNHSRSSGNNQTLKRVSNQNSTNDQANISQGQTKNSPQDKSNALVSSWGENNESKNKVENVEDVYTIGEKIGDGNFAIVRIGIKRDTKQKHALKIIDRKKIIGKENMLKDEIRIMKACHHENIVKLFDTLDTKFDVYLIMELVTGGDLFDEISNAVKFEGPVASSFAQDIANALDYLHEQNIVHRDLKPENLLVRKLHLFTQFCFLWFCFSLEL